MRALVVAELQDSHRGCSVSDRKVSALRAWVDAN
jgi:hypothetical protein